MAQCIICIIHYQTLFSESSRLTPSLAGMPDPEDKSLDASELLANELPVDTVYQPKRTEPSPTAM